MRKQVGDYVFWGDIPTIIKAIEEESEKADERDKQTLLQYREWLVVDGGEKESSKGASSRSQSRGTRGGLKHHKRRDRQHRHKVEA